MLQRFRVINAERPLPALPEPLTRRIGEVMLRALRLADCPHTCPEQQTAAHLLSEVAEATRQNYRLRHPKQPNLLEPISETDVREWELTLEALGKAC